MLNTQPVKLNEVRDFGQIVSTTFQFLKQNWRPLFRAIGVMCIPPALIGGALAGKAGAAMQQFSGNNPGDPMAVFSQLGASMIGMIPGYILLFVAYMLLAALVHEYIRAYHLGEHIGMTNGMLWDRMKGQLGTYFGASFLVGLLTMLAFVLCVIPGFYVWPILSLTLVVHAIERKGATGSMGRSNALVSKDFWPTLGVALVLGLLYYVVNVVVQLPSIIVGVVVGLNTGLDAARSGSGEMNFPAWFTMFSTISTAVQWCAVMFTYPIIAIGMSLKYFSLVEVQEGAGLQQRVQDFGNA